MRTLVTDNYVVESVNPGSGTGAVVAKLIPVPGPGNKMANSEVWWLHTSAHSLATALRNGSIVTLTIRPLGVQESEVLPLG